MSTGNLYGTVLDQNGNPLPDATVKLTGAGAPKIKTTDDDGEFSYEELQPGSYKAEAELEGFTPSAELVTITAGENTSVEITLTFGPKMTDL